MAYGLLLYKEIESPEGRHRLEIHKDGYSGAAAELNSLVRDSIVLSRNAGEVTDAITTSVLTFALYDTGQMDYAQFFTPNATLYKVVLKIAVGGATTTRWTGFITPDSYAENLASHDTITITARDNLGRLNDYDFSLRRGQMLSVRSIINSGLAVAGVAMETAFLTEKVATAPAATPVVDGLVNTSLLVGLSWHGALSLLLEGLGLTLAWNEGNRFEVRDITQSPSSAQSAFFIGKSGFRQIRPAWKNLTVSQDYGLRDNFYEGQFSREDCGNGSTFTPGPNALWTVSGSMALMNPYLCGAASPLDSIFMPLQGGDGIANSMTYAFRAPSMDRAIKMAVRCSNSAWRPGLGRGGTWAQPKIVTGQSQGQNIYRYYFLRWRFNIFATFGGTRYVLRETWVPYNPATIDEPYLYFVMPGSESGVDVDNEVTFYIAELPSAADVEFVVYAPTAQLTEDGNPISTVGAGNYGRMTDIRFSVDEGVSGRTQRITINADHNVQSEASFSVGRVPAGRGNALLYLGGLFYGDGDNTPLSSFKRSTGAASSYDLLELVAREHIGFNASNYDHLSGTMKAAAAFRFDRAVAFGGTPYRLVSAALNVLSNTLQVSAMQTECAFAAADYVIEEIDSEGSYTSRGSYSGGSVPQGPQGGGGYFYKLADDGIGTDYEINIVQEEDGNGDPVYKNISDILRHLSLRVVNAGQSDEYTVLVSDITLASERNVVAGGIGGGQASGISLAMLSDVSIAATPDDGQALCYNATTGMWEPRPVGGGAVTVTSDNATIGTALTRIATVAGVEIKAKIAEYLLASAFNAESIVRTLSITPVNRASYDSVGNNFLTTYGASLSIANGNLRLLALNGGVLSAITGANIVTLIDNNAVARATADANGNNIASTYLKTHQSVTLASGTNNGTLKITTAAGTVDNIAVKGLGSLAYKSSVAWGDVSSKPTTISGYGITDAKIASGVITLGNQTITPLTSVAVSNKDATIGTSLTTIATVQGTDIKVKIASYLLASDFTANNIVSTLGNTAVNRATADANGNAITTSYLRKNTDDTMAGNLTVGTASANKTLTLRGSTSAALNIYGGNNLTSIYRDATYLQVSSSLRVTGNIVATGNIDAGVASDRRLKNDIRSITLSEAADLLAVLNPVVYRWNEKAAELGGLNGIARGFIADEYLNLIPNAGRKIWDEYDAIDYNQVIPYLVAGWQQQNLRIRILESEVTTLKEENDIIRRRLRNGL